MRLRNVTGSEELIKECRYVIPEPVLYQGKWNRYFQNAKIRMEIHNMDNNIHNTDNKIHIEIGMGKGQFITGLASRYPDINYIGIEMYSSVLYRAVKKLERAALELNNLALLRLDARDLTAVFSKGEVSRIYLNFSDPWPKDRHAKRRITSREFLALYDEVLAVDGAVEFKTDNKDLFQFSLKEQEAAGWRLDKVSYDLHNDEEMIKGNVLTEYEEKFSALGKPIFKYVISR
ncbi:MAG: tRNA (guanosine(46)-N7)-methyltransferase TrmB [Lachnospiraceae bacterium]|nr:tRNA (guanosine(46)-N7)-methyltransferase TrmB [Lachnospiraceae bacterium]